MITFRRDSRISRALHDLYMSFHKCNGLNSESKAQWLIISELISTQYRVALQK